MARSPHTVLNIQKNNAAVGAKVFVRVGLCDSVMRRKLVSQLEAAACCELHKTVAAVAVGREALGVQIGVEIAITDDEEEVAIRIGARRSARHPDAAFASIRNKVEHAGLRERISAKGH